MGLNRFADMTSEEARARSFPNVELPKTNYIFTPEHAKQINEEVKLKADDHEPCFGNDCPDGYKYGFNWADYMTIWTSTETVKITGQGTECDASWAYTAIAGFETAYMAYQKTNPEKLSEQQIISCATDYSYGCKGGSPVDALQYARKVDKSVSQLWSPGLISWEAYDALFKSQTTYEKNCDPDHKDPHPCTPSADRIPSYYDKLLAAYFPSGLGDARNHYCFWLDAQCSRPASTTQYFTQGEGYYEILPSDSNSMQAALTKYGALMTRINWNSDDIKFYSGGIISSGTRCDAVEGQQDWWVTITGYGEDKARGLKYWIVKNSLDDWGENGYAKIEMTAENHPDVGNDGVCGIQKQTYFVSVDGAPCPEPQS